MKLSQNLSFLLVLSLLIPALAGAAAITNGIDTWITPPDGSSFADFSDNPIPAGFFCVGSKPFSDRIAWKGVPLVSEPSDALGNADTIIQRLDDAVFDRRGRAATRLQVSALSLASLEPIQTSCGAFDVTASLAGTQPVTTMEIVEQEEGKGYFNASLSLTTKITFTPVGVSTARSLVLDHSVVLDSQGVSWARERADGRSIGQVGGFVLVDTNGDQRPDTYLPGQSAFHPRGTEVPAWEEATQSRPDCYTQPPGLCHDGPGHCHCNYDPNDYPEQYPEQY